MFFMIENEILNWLIVLLSTFSKTMNNPLQEELMSDLFINKFIIFVYESF